MKTGLPLAFALACACAPQPQLLLVVDTDAPLVGQLPRDDLSPDAAIDLLRVDVLAGMEPIDQCEFVVPDPAAWPVSFGIATPPGPMPLRIRLRAFRQSLAVPDLMGGVRRLCGQPRGAAAGGLVTEPRREVTLDWLLLRAPPLSGVEQVRVVLSFDCFGEPASLYPVPTTCIDASRRKAAPTEQGAVEQDATAGPLPGTARAAAYTGCAGQAPPGTRCVPGGFFIQGEPELVGRGDEDSDPLPLRPVRLSPFYMDQTELTLAQARELVAQGKMAEPVLRGSSGAPDSQLCTWDPAGLAQVPLNCVSQQEARFACRNRSGGDLPTEAQWEYAARGRGDRRRYPWGDEPAGCCTASLARGPDPKEADCGTSDWPEPVGSHPAVAGCPGRGDVSRDGLLDLGGSLSEWTQDSFQPYRAGCAGGSGITPDPVCHDVSTSQVVPRGADFTAGLATALSAQRSRNTTNAAPTKGFRCVYPAGPP